MSNRPPSIYQRITLVRVTAGMAQQIEDFRFEHRLKTESEAVRRLLEMGLNMVGEPSRKEK